MKKNFLSLLNIKLFIMWSFLILPFATVSIVNAAEVEVGCLNGEICEEQEELPIEIPEIYIKAVNPGYTINGLSNVGEMIEIGKNSETPFSLAGAAVGYTNSSGNYSILFEFPENSWITGEAILLRLASSPMSELAAVNYTKTLAFKGAITLEKDGEIIDEVCWSGAEGCFDAFNSSSPSVLIRNLDSGLFERVSEYEPVFDAEAYKIIEEEISDDANEEGAIEEGEIQEDLEENKEDEDENTEENAMEKSCEGLRITEIYSYFENSKDEQFIEFYNESENVIELSQCKLRYKNKKYDLKDEIQSNDYYIYKPSEFSLTKNPTKYNTIELLDYDDNVIYKVDYLNGQKKGAAYAVYKDENDAEIWEITFALTPGEENRFETIKECGEGMVFESDKCVEIKEEAEKTCEEGYYLNPETNRCKKIVIEEEKTCKEGYYLNPETNRCKKIIVEEEKVCNEGYYLNEETGRCRKIKMVEEEEVKVCKEGYYLNPETNRCKKVVQEEEKICKEGYYLNPETNRCKKIATTTTVVKTCKEGYYLNPLTNRCRKEEVETAKTCKEGYYLNEETGRCKKIKENNGADYSVVPEEYEEKTAFVGLYAVLGVIAVLAIYLIYEFRKEIVKIFKKLTKRK